MNHFHSFFCQTSYTYLNLLMALSKMHGDPSVHMVNARQLFIVIGIDCIGHTRYGVTNVTSLYYRTFLYKIVMKYLQICKHFTMLFVG
jgi:hypothetical protein